MTDRDRWLAGILAGGIALRALVFFVAAPQNRDAHWEVILWVVEKHALPTSEQLSQSYQPPLYYVLMAPLARMGGAALVHAASLLFSCINLLIIYRLTRRKDLFCNRIASVFALALAAFLPQYVMNGHFISNDTLAILIGTILSAAVYQYLTDSTRSMRWLILTAVLVGLGLLTKGTFLLTGPALTAVVGIVESRAGRGRSQIAGRLAVFCCIWLVLGCYKYVENFSHLGNPIVHNLDADPEWARSQRGVYKGLRTIIDINPLPLVRQPVLNHRDMRESYAQLFYATFWYSHIPDSSFRAGEYGYGWVGSALYVAGIIPTILFLVGMVRAFTESARWLWKSATADPRGGVLAASLALLGSNFLIVMAAGIRYDVWSCFQSRLCFQSMIPILVILGQGIEFASRNGRFQKIIVAFMSAAIVGCILYFCVEIALAGELLSRGPKLEF